MDDAVPHRQSRGDEPFPIRCPRRSFPTASVNLARMALLISARSLSCDAVSVAPLSRSTVRSEFCQEWAPAACLGIHSFTYSRLRCLSPGFANKESRRGCPVGTRAALWWVATLSLSNPVWRALVWQLGYIRTFIKHCHHSFNLNLYKVRQRASREKAKAMITHDCIVGSDPNGIRRVYASTWIEARQEARSYIRQRADTAPLSAWRFELLVESPTGAMPARSTEL